MFKHAIEWAKRVRKWIPNYQEYIEYDIDRQLNLESYGYKFLRINKFTLLPKTPGQTKTDILNKLLLKAMEGWNEKHYWQRIY